jgi:hypothetical protein
MRVEKVSYSELTCDRCGVVWRSNAPVHEEAVLIGVISTPDGGGSCKGEWWVLCKACTELVRDLMNGEEQ